VRIVDGDTIYVTPTGRGPLPRNASHAIRLLQIDTPETQHPTVGVECGGPKASSYAKRVLAGETVYLEADVEDTDRYGRFLRYVYLDDGRMFNQQAIRMGYGEAVLYEPNDRHIGLMRRAQAQARQEQAGIWGPPCDYDAPPPEPEPDPEPEPEPEPDPGGGCEAGYDPCVPAFPPDVNCDDVNGPITVTGSDPHGLDADNDGVACES